MTRVGVIAKANGMSPLEAASYWAVRRDGRALSAREDAEFRRWLENPVNADAFADTVKAMNLFQPAITDDQNLNALRRAALSTRSPPHYFRYGLAAASLAAVAVVALGVQLPFQPVAHAPPAPNPPSNQRAAPASRFPGELTPVVYSTRTGERRDVRLPDGSTATLNTHTRITFNFGPSGRVVHLLTGQALFEVAHDASHPFTVQAGAWRTTALGTIFEVRLDGSRQRIVLARGKVSVARTGGDTVYLRPGQAAIVDGVGAPRVIQARLDEELSWRKGLIEFADESVGSAIAEINRYSRRHIEVAADGVADLHVSGVFKTGDPDGFVDALTKVLPIHATTTDQGAIRLSRSDQDPRP